MGEEYIYSSCFINARAENGNISGNPLFINTSGDSSTWDFHFRNGSPCIDTGMLEDAPELDIEGNPRPGQDGKVCMGAYESPEHYTPSAPLPPIRIYVNKNGNNTSGTSWQDAFTSITRALSDVDGENLYGIWVAEGTYKEGDTITVPSRIDLYGSFKGTETCLSERSIQKNRTIIDGEESYGCIHNNGTIDGFYVTNGKSSYGGGIKNMYGSIRNCSIYYNSSTRYGGGIYNESGTVSNSNIYSNSSIKDGGGIFNSHGTITKCNINFNSSKDDGGGLRNIGETISCYIYSNSAISDGGGICNQGKIINCIFGYNIADNGGGISHHSGNIYNSILFNNLSSENCGGIWNTYGEIVNTVLYNNVGGILNNEKYYSHVINCISFQNGAYDISGDGIVEHSCFREATGTNGNINSDPLFENIEGNISSWDFHIRDGSPCIDAGVPDETNYDACSPPGKLTLINDMGAYGGPYNCWGEFFMSKQDLIDHLLGRKDLSSERLPLADKNTDDIIDIADLVQMMLMYPTPPGFVPPKAELRRGKPPTTTP